jgi:HD-like signal output (HDOD) protein
MRDIRTEIDKINEIVSLPTVLAEIMGELGKTEATSSKITSLIETDPALTGSVLRAVNSPFYGLRWRVNSVSSAIALLGLTETARLLTAFYMKQRLFSLNTDQQTYLEQLWKHSVSTAAIARLVVKEFGILTGGKEFTAALMHDMGKIVLVQYFPKELTMIGRMVRELEQHDIDAEDQVVAISHPAIGGLLGEKWRLPLDYVEVMRLHHAPQSAQINPELVSVVRFADLLAEQWGLGIGEQPEATLFEGDESFALLAQHEPRLKEQGIDEVKLKLSERYEEQREAVSMF